MPNNRGKQLFINKADLQVLIIKLTDENYPENFGKDKYKITKYFPVNLKSFQ